MVPPSRFSGRLITAAERESLSFWSLVNRGVPPEPRDLSEVPIDMLLR
jgi:hypothetical protein